MRGGAGGRTQEAQAVKDRRSALWPLPSCTAKQVGTLWRARQGASGSHETRATSAAPRLPPLPANPPLCRVARLRRHAHPRRRALFLSTAQVGHPRPEPRDPNGSRQPTRSAATVFSTPPAHAVFAPPPPPKALLSDSHRPLAVHTARGGPEQRGLEVEAKNGGDASEVGDARRVLRNEVRVLVHIVRPFPLRVPAEPAQFAFGGRESDQSSAVSSFLTSERGDNRRLRIASHKAFL